MIFSSSFLHAVTFLHVLHLDVLKRQIEIETESKNSNILMYGDNHGNPYIHSTTVLCDNYALHSTINIMLALVPAHW